jgi:ATP-dependent Clp protease adaptor protein ClpS
MADTNTELLEQVEVVEKKSDVKHVVLHNDDHNSFDHVINTLIEVCGHDMVQAEQCTFIVHFKGKCEVKRGAFSELRPIRNELNNRGLTATIE